jgi:hypothetical protein
VVTFLAEQAMTWPDVLGLALILAFAAFVFWVISR